MKISVSKDPATALADQLHTFLANHWQDTTLCFLAGGSALALLEHLELSEDQKCRTIFCLGDERVSGEEDSNNYLQVKSRLPEDLKNIQLIKTQPFPEENAKLFAARLSTELQNILNEHQRVKIINILGIGDDGHTAAIFPMTESDFDNTYKKVDLFVPVQVPDNEHRDRISLRPDWILDTADQVLGYATGESKCHDVLQTLLESNFELHEMPAELIKRHRDSWLFTDCDGVRRFVD